MTNHQPLGKRVIKPVLEEINGSYHLSEDVYDREGNLVDHRTGPSTEQVLLEQLADIFKDV